MCARWGVKRQTERTAVISSLASPSGRTGGLGGTPLLEPTVRVSEHQYRNASRHRSGPQKRFSGIGVLIAIRVHSAFGMRTLSGVVRPLFASCCSSAFLTQSSVSSDPVFPFSRCIRVFVSRGIAKAKGGWTDGI